MLTVAQLAPGLSEGELRLLLELCRRAIAPDVEDFTFRASSRDLAESARCSRKWAQTWLHKLGERGLVTYRTGTATRATAIRVNIFQVVQTTFGGVAPAATPELSGGVTTTPPLASEWRRHDATTPPAEVPAAVESMELFPNPAPPVDIESASISDSVLDRMLRATPEKADPEQMKNAREWVHGYQCKFGRDPNPHAPDARFLAQLTAIATPEQIRGVLQELMLERKEPGHNYAWYISVALQRIHSIPWQQVKAARERWKVYKGRPTASIDTAAMLSDLSERKAL